MFPGLMSRWPRRSAYPGQSPESQGGRRSGFPLEATERLWVAGEFSGKKLQGNMATELQVFRLIHDTHAPTANLAEDAVMGNRLPYGLGGCAHWVEMLGVGSGVGQCFE
jgi:hypothetical protein